MRAVKNNLPTPSGEVGESEGPRWTRAGGDQSAHPLESTEDRTWASFHFSSTPVDDLVNTLAFNSHQ